MIETFPTQSWAFLLIRQPINQLRAAWSDLSNASKVIPVLNDFNFSIPTHDMEELQELQIDAKISNQIFPFSFSTGKPFFQCGDDQVDESVGFLDGNLQIGSPNRSSPNSQGSDNGERFSRKVFVGGLPPDIDEGS